MVKFLFSVHSITEARGRAEPGRRHCLKCTKIKERGGEEKGRKGRARKGKEGKGRGGEKKERRGETRHTNILVCFRRRCHKREARFFETQCRIGDN